jgi:hypothetical protein
MVRRVSDAGTPRRGVFAPADERPYRRLVGDWIRLTLAVPLVAVRAANAPFLRAPAVHDLLPPIRGNFVTKKLIADC